MGKYYCCMPECHNFKGKTGKFGKSVTLHKLPSNRTIRRAWITAISRKKWKPTAYTRVCSDHFEDGIGPCCLTRNKVPTVNLAQKHPSVKKERIRRHLQEVQNQEEKVQYQEEKVQDQEKEVQDQEKSPSTLENPLMFHGYASGIFSTHEETDSIASHSISVQTSPNKNNVSTHTERPDITIEDIQGSDVKIMFYTGLPSFLIFNSLFLTLIEFGGDKLCSEKTNTFKNETGRKRKLRSIDEFLLVMMRLRLGLLVKDLEYRFKISGSSVSKIFKSWIVFMYKYLQSLVYLPRLEILQKSIPPCFTHFRDTRIILDCTEIFIQTPSLLENQSVTYSNYKSHNTFKALVGVSMTGTTVFVSKLWGGSASDVQITRASSLLQMLEKGDAVMVDKGFIHLKPDLEKLGVKLYCPPFKTKSQFSKEEVELTRRIASARIHVERKMEQIKNFRILQGVLPLAINKISSEIFFVCSALTNLMPPLVK